MFSETVVLHNSLKVLQRTPQYYFSVSQTHGVIMVLSWYLIEPQKSFLKSHSAETRFPIPLQIEEKTDFQLKKV